MRHRFWLVGLLMLLFALGCGRAKARSSPLQVAAAGNLAPLLPGLLDTFRAQTDISTVPILASSGKLAQQIIQGAPYDVFLSADASYVDDLIAGGYILPSSRLVYAQGVLVLAVRCDGPVQVQSLADLTAPDVHRIALANPEHAPYGRAAREALQRAGLWEALQPRLVFADTVRQAMQFVLSGNAQVGLVALSVTRGEACVHFVEVPQTLYSPLQQTAGIVARTPHLQAAQQFLAFLAGSSARDFFRRYGYGVPAATEGLP